MEMVAVESIQVGEDLMLALSPLAYSLHDSFLVSHCASCFNPLPLPIDHHNQNHSHDVCRYCSSTCSSSHSSLIHFSDPHLYSSSSCNGETSDIRVALIFLHQIKHSSSLSSSSYDRICGLMTNRPKLLPSSSSNNDNDEFNTKIINGAKAIAEAASMMTDNRSVFALDSADLSLEEAVLCLVITNAVEVQDSIGRSVGIAVYDTSFSWINHSCSPNACYRFLPPMVTQSVTQQCLITPVISSNAQKPVINSDFLLTGFPSGGPKIVLRSIKPINKGEQVTISYTDLLQPKDFRQSELWSKYKFICHCHRCSTIPLSYVDQRLQEIWGSGGRLLHDTGVENFTNCIHTAIDDYLSSSDAESCCTQLENTLLNGLFSEQLIIRLHPQNHLSLNAYTTLASAYKVRANSVEHEHAAALNINKSFSAAYSLLLAIQTHHLFLSESSLIASASNFWFGAGESLVNLATTLTSNSALDLPNCKCSRCRLHDIFEAYKLDHSTELDISKDFLNCITDLIPKVWKFLVDGNDYLEVVKNPMNLRWFEILNSDNKCDAEKTIEGYEGHGRAELLGLGVHCLLYGGILSNIIGGHDSHLSCNVRRLLYDGQVKL